MAILKSMSGFIEWLPAQQVVEDTFVRTIRESYELRGFSHLFLRSVEPISELLRKEGGDTNKEIYGVQRIHADAGDSAELGLHFDLTIPFARYVRDHAGHLSFPFKRFQIQRSWRGERAQKGRYREFIQADADVVTRGTLPPVFDVEMPQMLVETMDALPIPPVTLHINNVKVLEGFCAGIGIEDPQTTLRIVDKLDKIGPDKVRAILSDTLSAEQIDKLLALAAIRTSDASFVAQVEALGVSSERLDQGLQELVAVMEGLSFDREDAVLANLGIARGLDYYTGTVFEGLMAGHETVGTVCSGGRYDRLASAELPGIGISIGVTRLLGILLADDRLAGSRSTPTCVLVALNDEAHRPAAAKLARTLRGRGIATEVFHEPLPYGKQIKQAVAKGIPYIWFAETEGPGQHKVKNLGTKEEQPADPERWMPDEADLRPKVRRKA